MAQRRSLAQPSPVAWEVSDGGTNPTSPVPVHRPSRSAVLVGSLVAGGSRRRRQAAETPRRGGVLLAVIGADAPSLDPHQEQTFATLQPVAPALQHAAADRSLQLPERHRRRGQRVEDLARRADLHVQDPPGHQVPRRLAADGRRRQGDLRQDRLPAGRGPQHPEEPLLGDREHRGPGSGHRGVQAQVPVGLAPGEPRLAVERHLPEEVPRQGPEPLQERTSIGSGPFKFKSYTRGSTFEGERNPDYFVKDRPYLDGYKFFISTETSVRAAAIRSGRAYIEFRDLPQRRGRGDQEAARRQDRRPGRRRSSASSASRSTTP